MEMLCKIQMHWSRNNMVYMATMCDVPHLLGEPLIAWEVDNFLSVFFGVHRDGLEMPV